MDGIESVSFAPVYWEDSILIHILGMKEITKISPVH